MASFKCRGASLIELIFALVVLELAGLLALSAALGVGRVHRRTIVAGQFDLARADSLIAAASHPDCTAAPTASIRPLVLPAGEARPRLTVLVRCGR